MYLCERCGLTLEQLPPYHEPHGEITMDRRCPECGGYSMVEAVECFRCGALIPEAEAVRDRDFHRICDRCASHDEEEEAEYSRRLIRRRTFENDSLRIDSGIYVPA